MDRPARFAPWLLLALLALTACDRGAAEPDAPTPEADPEAPLARLPEHFEGAWQGVLPCVDCDGIDVELALIRDESATGRFRLLERYLGRDDEGFASEGTWQEEACTLDDDTGLCIVLVEPGQRWFRHEDGALQAVSADGLALDPEGARLMRR